VVSATYSDKTNTTTMELSGTVISLLPEVSGQGKNGTWRKKEFILEVPAQYPRKVCISLWGERIDQANLSEGDSITAYIDVESREYNNRWYTEVKAWKVEKQNAAGNAPTGDFGPPPNPDFSPSDSEDDLPF
jgi:hypothetical protein